MRKPGTYTALEDLGRVRLSKYFFMRNFLYSEISNFYQQPNIPEDCKLAIKAGSRLACEILDPLVETFGSIEIRSGFRSSHLNGFGATQVKPQKCSANDKNYSKHIWDRLDANGNMGATVSVVVPWFADQYENGRDWRDFAWWMHDHLNYSDLCFFPKLAAFNVSWHEVPKRSINSYIEPKGLLLKSGAEPFEALEVRKEYYNDFPTFRAIKYPPPSNWPDKS